ncbi:acid phosphatase [Compostibacter hankyongensis]|uniref:acid phosphatase n=1 Tax=Compostibacter hankyongensis TaxID=1007089 RepID=UPI0031EB4831
MKNKIACLFALGVLGLGGCKSKQGESFDEGIKKINHVVVIYMENHSFDNLYGEFEGADGLADAPASHVTQLDENGKPYTYLPAIPRTSVFPTNLPNHYFNIDQYVPSDQEIPDVLHRYYQERMQIDSGRMDKFALYNSSQGLTMGHYKTSLLPLYPLAKQYTLCDHFFHSGFGCSFFNHVWLIAAAPPVFPNAPASMVAKMDSTGKMISDGVVTPDGFVVNTAFSIYSPHPKGYDTTKLMPGQTMPTIGDRLSGKDISWAWYAGGWDSALAGKPDPTFCYHHQPFAYFANYGDGTSGREEHLKDESAFFEAAKNGTLPAVSFVKPLGIDDEHPGYSNVHHGESHAVELVNAVLNGPNAKDALVIVTYDENGGFWDHVAPPVIDRWGPGSRIPAIIISPFAKKGFVDHTQYETVSILSFIERRWDLKPLTDRDKKAAPLQNAFSF